MPVLQSSGTRCEDKKEDTITVRAYRTRLNTNDTRKVSVTFRVVPADQKQLGNPSLEEVEGGVTGYESFYIDQYIRWLDLMNFGWRACAGTPGSWDELWIPAESMRQIALFVADRI